MALTITLSDSLAKKLQYLAEQQQQSPDELASTILAGALETNRPVYDNSALEALVAKIKATPPNPAMIRPASGSLAEALRNAPEDPSFDLETWTKSWGKIEAEMKAIDHANDIAEGLN